MNTTADDQTIDFHVRAPVAEEFDGESIKENEAVLKFISDMLMDDDDYFENQPSAPHHDHYSSADHLLQATEKSLYDALIDRSSDFVEKPIQTLVLLPDSSAANKDNTPVVKQKNRHREADDFLTTDEQQYISRSSKQAAIKDDDNDEEPLEMYDDVMLHTNSGQRRRRSRKPKNNKSLPKREGVAKKVELVDLRILLMQCAQAMERFDSKAAKDVLDRIRKHSSPLGTASERMAHYFAKALEARLSGTVKSPTTSTSCRTFSRGVLNVLRMWITSSPFTTMSNLFVKSTVANLAADDVAATVHVIDFGIMYGFQWPSLIQALSERPGGPPKLRITGIDDPLPGFRPAERVLHTGAHLARYCERFEVPFEYNGIAKAWDGIRIEDLNLREGEVVVVCSLYRMHGLSDNEADDSPKDKVLRLIRQVEPRVFIHGIVNNNTRPFFFVQRFKEALSHYEAMFDMLEATVPPDEEGQMSRVGFEEIVLGGEAMNAIACEGAEIVENRETYKQWGCRTRRIGFRQLPVQGEIMRRVKKLKSSYHKEFSLSEDDNWVLLEWKGRVMFAFSSWQPGKA